MIRSHTLVVLATALCASPPADASTETARAELPSDGAISKPDESIAAFRSPFDVLTERTIGSASKPVRFDWRRTTAHIAATGGQLAELNNFDSVRSGGVIRIPSSGMMWEVGLSYVWVFDNTSSRKLARTPYRQPARPRRFELDVALGLPLAEGVVTAWPGFFPAAEMVLNAYANVRYLIYPSAFSGLGWRRSAQAIISPGLSDREVRNLDDRRLASMQIDPGRYGILLGLGNDIYFQSGFFVSPRAMLAVPLLAPATGTELKYWLEVCLAIGWAI